MPPCPPRLITLTLTLVLVLAISSATAHIPVVHYHGVETFTELAAAGLPVVVRGSPMAAWVAAGDWTPEAVMARAGRATKVLAKIGESQSPWFYKGCCPASQIALADVLIPPISALDVADDDSPGSEIYYYASYLRGPLLPLAAVLDDADAAGVYVRGSHPDSRGHQFWTGSPSATTLLHYDPVHNVYAQLHGRKRFALAPSQAWPHLGVFPRHHMQHRDARFARSHKLELEIVDLVAGDVLYLPPGTFHQVSALADSDGPSISVNFWSGVALIPLSPRIPCSAVASLLDALAAAASPHLAFAPYSSLRAALRTMYPPEGVIETPTTSPFRPVYGSEASNPDLKHHAGLIRQHARATAAGLARPLHRPAHQCRLDLDLVTAFPARAADALDVAATSALADAFARLAARDDAQRAPGLVAMYIGHYLDDMLSLLYGMDAASSIAHIILSAPPPASPPTPQPTP
ncbi:uncharacterized protein AMSG_07708 [Thecamonas trahens ATCC 50062]|uniref:JmjC domain-containing protein n=1 Tax=Thecamonas trahens ATCC 50062 TaxID=461836 RepID=A0A0L0DHG3_THETB|nr:hypothetical protein AMSG_07708 [Thecamonas trahens ATCC 50062]KNC51645.1 hypothetical protein AMSG_07708 [Thecamonas trahens ATCC 50062]|eukprot:XP_013755785.1 hypothetical protein AMSG_07708 [Thecamonas trahens ATCC 50062]